MGRLIAGSTRHLRARNRTSRPLRQGRTGQRLQNNRQRVDRALERGRVQVVE